MLAIALCVLFDRLIWKRGSFLLHLPQVASSAECVHLYSDVVFCDHSASVKHRRGASIGISSKSKRLDHKDHKRV